MSRKSLRCLIPGISEINQRSNRITDQRETWEDRRTVPDQHCQTAKLPDCHTAKLSDCQTARLPGCKGHSWCLAPSSSARLEGSSLVFTPPVAELFPPPCDCQSTLGKQSAVLYSTGLHSIALHYTVLHFTTLYCISRQYIVLHKTVLHFTALLYCTATRHCAVERLPEFVVFTISLSDWAS